jgi:hypothetical protein
MNESEHGSERTLTDAVNAQVALLRDGKPLVAFDSFFARHVQMFANDVLFASGAEEGRRKQEPFVAAATSIFGAVTHVNVVEDRSVCVFWNRSRFTTVDGVENQIDGLSWQRWEALRVVEERYYDGDMMRALIAEGVLDDPALLLARNPAP